MKWFKNWRLIEHSYILPSVLSSLRIIPNLRCHLIVLIAPSRHFFTAGRLFNFNSWAIWSYVRPSILSSSTRDCFSDNGASSAKKSNFCNLSCNRYFLSLASAISWGEGILVGITSPSLVASFTCLCRPIVWFRERENLVNYRQQLLLPPPGLDWSLWWEHLS